MSEGAEVVLYCIAFAIGLITYTKLMRWADKPYQWECEHGDFSISSTDKALVKRIKDNHIAKTDHART